MDAVRLGAVFRAVRLKLGWRQGDVARQAGVSAATVSRIERGHVRALSVDTLLRVAAALEMRIDVVARWRGGELDRMLGAGHAAMHESVARTLQDTEWLMAPEATFSIYGERGIVDILAFHPPTGALLVIELKTDLVDVQALIGAVDRYRRLAPQMARERGWTVRSVSCWVVLRDSPANHRRLAAHATVLRTAFPQDGRHMRAWLQAPSEPVAALSFLSDSHRGNAMTTSSGVQRVRTRSSRSSAAAKRRQLSPGANPIGIGADFST
jgi:HTH-type transcriptional regulator / antitoxin HipB